MSLQISVFEILSVFFRAFLVFLQMHFSVVILFFKKHSLGLLRTLYFFFFVFLRYNKEFGVETIY
jgi:hypothetical protein